MNGAANDDGEGREGGPSSARDECDDCDERDAQGYPHAARRRLRKNHDDAGTVTDIDTGQRFKVRKTKEGDRIVPLFDKQVQWKSASGYDALRLCLSCLGAPGEYVLWDEATGAEMTREEWCKRKFVSQSKIPIRHLCGRLSTKIVLNITKGQGVRCPGCDPRWQSEEGYEELKRLLMCLGTPSEYMLWDEATGAAMTREEWCKRKYLAKSKVPIRHSCGLVNTTTVINSIQRGNKPGCPCKCPSLNGWSNRYAEFVAHVPNGYELQLTESEWVETCEGAHWCPPIRCNLHGFTFSTTSISNFLKGDRGCAMCNPSSVPWSERYSEFVALLPDGYTLELTQDEWKQQCTGNKFRPPIRCNIHGTTTATTWIASLQSGKGVGCPGCVPMLKNWADRYAEFVALLPDGYTLQLSHEEWKEQCVSAHWCPPIHCNVHCIMTTSTNINNIVQTGGIGCPQCVPQINPWSNRYAEFVDMLPSGYTLQLYEDEWKQQCTGVQFCPPIRCETHRTVSMTTSIANLSKPGRGVGCIQCVPLLARKTEANVLKWLESAFPAATIAREVPGPGKTHFDFVLTFEDKHIVLEVDGPHHFWKDYYMYIERIPERDAEKARWALARGQWVVRVLANDVEKDRNGWRAWLRRAIDEARAGAATTGAAPRVLTPDAPEYRSPASAYVDPHVF